MYMYYYTPVEIGRGGRQARLHNLRKYTRAPALLAILAAHLQFAVETVRGRGIVAELNWP